MEQGRDGEKKWGWQIIEENKELRTGKHKWKRKGMHMEIKTKQSIHMS